jgi:hypothetical protein
MVVMHGGAISTGGAADLAFGSMPSAAQSVAEK